MKKSTHPDAVFGADNGAPTNGAHPDVAQLAAQIKHMDMRALTATQYEDVLTILEFMQGYCVSAYEDINERRRELQQREQELAKREKDVALRARAVDVVLRTPQEPPFKVSQPRPGLKRYFGG